MQAPIEKMGNRIHDCAILLVAGVGKRERFVCRVDARALGAFLKVVSRAKRGYFGLLSAQNLLDGENLYPG